MRTLSTITRLIYSEAQDAERRDTGYKKNLLTSTCILLSCLVDATSSEKSACLIFFLIPIVLDVHSNVPARAHLATRSARINVPTAVAPRSVGILALRVRWFIGHSF